MPTEKQDYVLRLIEELGRLIAEIVNLRQRGSYDTALQMVLQAQQRLFGRPAEAFIGRSIDDQVHLLVVGENPANARAKCVAYATLLTEAAGIYQAREQTALAGAACQWALQVLIAVRAGPGDAQVSALAARLGALLDRLPEDPLIRETKALIPQTGAQVDPDAPA